MLAGILFQAKHAPVSVKQVELAKDNKKVVTFFIINL